MEGPFNDPDVPHGERTAYRGLLGGEEAGSGEVVVERGSEGSRELYRLAVSARVAGGGAEVQAETTFRRSGGTIHAERHTMRVLAGAGEPAAVEEARFRDVKVPAFGGELEPYPRDVTPLVGCALALRGLELEEDARRGFSVWLAATAYWEVEARVERRERVEVPAGALDAWRVRLRPSFERMDNALDRLVEAVVPPVVAHLAAEPSHRLVRLEFPTGPFRENPRGLIEATELA